MKETRLTNVENPILFEPWEEPIKHWDFSENAKSPLLKNFRRPSQPSVALGRNIEPISINSEPYKTINFIRERVRDWRELGFRGSSAKKLLMSWNDRAAQDEGIERPFFCQREAVETISWLLTCKEDESVQGTWDHLNRVNTEWNDGLNRLAVKMATGAGKTRTMSMLQAVISTIHPDGCMILVIAPNLTVQERLQELRELQNDRSIISIDHPKSAYIQIINFQKFRHLDYTFSGLEGLTNLHRSLLRPIIRSETESQMIDRLLGEAYKDQPLYVFQDEGHHCRRDQVTKRDLKEEEIDSSGHWYRTLLALRESRNLEAIIDFSATPAYLEKPKKLSSPLFPWCVTDFSVEDAQESGICKIARIPFQAENESEVDMRLTAIYEYCQEKGHPTKWGSDPPPDVQEVFRLLAEHWKNERLPAYQIENRTPALIAVVNTIHNARILYQWLAGTRNDGNWIPGAIDEFSNIDRKTLQPKKSLPTLVVHSHINNNDELNKATAEVVKEQMELRAPDKSNPEGLKLIRKIFQTVGQRDQPGEHIRCVISVAMLSEGWDAKTVTHVFGFRKFGSLLLCEQVIGRALRRPSLDNPRNAEYAEVLGVPYPGLIAIEDTGNKDLNPIIAYRISSVEKHQDHRLHWPKIKGIHAKPAEGRRYELDQSLVKEWSPTIPESIVAIMKDPLWRGETSELNSEKFRERNQKSLYELAQTLCKKWVQRQSSLDSTMRQGVLFVDAINAIKDWCAHPLIGIADLAPLNQRSWHEQLIDEVISSCVSEIGAQSTMDPIWENPNGSRKEIFSDTGGVEFETTLKFKYPEIEEQICDSSELNRAACHSQSEADIATYLDSSDIVRSWVRNFRLGWRIPWWDPATVQWREYEPDFLVELATVRKCFVVVEMKGIENENSKNKAHAASRWCDLVSNIDAQQVKGQWEYLLVTKPEELKNKLRSIVLNYD